MRILQLHTSYVYPGGEDVVVELECELLRAGGHAVEQLLPSNRALSEDRRFSVRGAARALFRRRDLHREVARRLAQQRPDVLHVHNTFARLGSAIYAAAAEQGVPVVQTVHNYRFACAHGALLRQGRPCEDCVGGTRWPAIRHRCYRGSLPLTVAALGLQWDQNRASRLGQVHTFIAPTSFVRERMLRDGVDGTRVVVKAHFTPEPTMPHSAGGRPRQIIFAGWMVPEKGVDLLMEAWDLLRPADAQLVLAGDGPLRGTLEARYAGLAGVRWMGWLSREELDAELDGSRALVVPSRAYESFGLVVIEAFAMATPVVAPRHGAFLELLDDARTGLFFQPGSAEDLARSIAHMLELPVPAWEELSGAARAAYLARFTPAANLEALDRIYASAVAGAPDPLAAETTEMPSLQRLP